MAPIIEHTSTRTTAEKIVAAIVRWDAVVTQHGRTCPKGLEPLVALARIARLLVGRGWLLGELRTSMWYIEEQVEETPDGWDSNSEETEHLLDAFSDIVLAVGSLEQRDDVEATFSVNRALESTARADGADVLQMRKSMVQPTGVLSVRTDALDRAE